jgi:HK97 family phage major capsid protein
MRYKELMNAKHQAATARKKAFLPLNLQYFADPVDPPAQKTTAELLGEIKNNSAQLAKTLQKQDEEIKKHGTTLDDTVNKLKELGGNYDQLVKDLNEMQAQQQRPGAGGGQEKGISLGEYFASHDTVKGMAGTGSRGSAPVEIKSFYAPFEAKDLTSASGSGGTLVTPQRQVGIVGPAGERGLRIRDLLNVQPTTANAIEFVRETGFTNNAAIQANEGDAKGQSDLTFGLESASVKTIAHWVPASRQILDDAGQIRNYVDNRLLYGLKLKEENQILYGDGLTGNMLGIMNDAGIQNQGARAAGATDNILDWIRRSFTKVRLAEYPVTGLTLNPVNWEQIELMKGDDGHYIWISVTEGGEPRVFRVPVVETTAMAENEFLAGAFGLGAQLWDREQANVRFSESHADYFTRNMVAILAEERLALTIERPEAFVKGSLAPVPAV